MNNGADGAIGVHRGLPPSPWVTRWAPLIRPGGRVLDVACGSGRHMRWLATAGHAVTGIDRSPEAIAAVAPFGTAIQADIENGPWPLSVAGQTATFDAVVVTHYLWRALFPTLLASVAPGGVLIYETFSAGNETVGKPSNPNFLLRPSELLAAFPGLHIVAFEEGFLDAPARYVQRLVAVRADPAHTAAEMPRFPLA